MKHNEFNFNYHNTDFYGQSWIAKSTKAVVVIVHGMSEHSSRYHEVAKFLTDNHYSVFAFDHFGHGKTTGKRGHNPSFDAVLESVSLVIEKASAEFPDKPMFLYGQSMGGNVVLNYVLRKENNLQGVVSTSPFLRLSFTPPAIKLFAGKIIQKIAPSLTMGNELVVGHLSRDAEEVQKYVDDPLVHDKISPNYSLVFFDTGEWAIANASKTKVPMLVMHGDHDKITSHEGSADFVKNSKSGTLKIYEGGYHELHNDTCRDEMLQDVLNWLDSQL
ncbi:MAG: alpha/beta hydrolase [Flavobacteriaceae bacterium]|nr:alpha/beta hydrolase [Flavobacteriaceae bacterium]|tara:strand:+ start:131143 stop:131964 length:822 start_codon:yes stop_codon:yes gene_type:complete